MPLEVAVSWSFLCANDLVGMRLAFNDEILCLKM